MPTISAPRPVASLATRTIFGHRPAPAVVLALFLTALLIAGCGSISLPGQTSGTRTTTTLTSPWRTLSSPTTATDFFGSPAMVSPSEGWAVGMTGEIAHYVNGRWTTLTSPTIPELYSLAMVSPSEGWAVGNGTIVHYAHGQWSPVYCPPTWELYSLAMVSPSEGWAVGASGTIVHYAKGQWTSVNSPTSNDLYSIAMVSPSEGWAAGWGQPATQILHYAHGQWSTVNTPPNISVERIAMASASEGWAVGTDTFLHYVNGQWRSVSGPTAHYVLTSLAMVSPSDGWAEGTNTSTGSGDNSNLLLHYTGGQWKIVSGPITQGLTYDPFGHSLAMLEVTYPCQRPFDPLFLCSPVRFSIPV